MTLNQGPKSLLMQRLAIGQVAAHLDGVAAAAVAVPVASASPLSYNRVDSEVYVLRPLLLLGFVPLLALPAWGQSYQMIWHDEFDGTQLDLTHWEPQLGTGCPQLCGWGNNELQYYRAENATVAGGFLTITAKRENFGGANYTSARLRTRNRGDWKYGRFEMRAKMPIGQGLWPAFWMLPTDGVYGTWAASGEIDIVEFLGHDPDRVSGTLHYGGPYPLNQYSSSAFNLASGNFNDDFHVFALEWEPCEMRWYVDGNLYATKTNWSSTGGSYPAPFDQRFHLLLNLAVGGNLPGPPDATTVFPQQLIVDYVRVFQLPDVSACLTEFDGMDHADPYANGWFSFGGSVGGGGIGANTADLPPIEGCRASIQSGWGSGGTPGYFGGFGRDHPSDLIGYTHFTFWIHPDPGQQYVLQINLQDDDNGDDAIPGTPDGADDEFQYDCVVSPVGPDVVSGGGWQRVSIPLASFVDDNSYHFGGNGVFDPYPVGSGGNGRLINVIWTIVSTSGADVTFRTDRWAFTRQNSSVAGRVWSDTDADGTFDPAESGLGGVGVTLVDAALGSDLASQLTASDGSYSFGTLLGGTYALRIDPATLPPGSVPTFDPDGTVSADQFTLDLGCFEVANQRDFGYAPLASDVTPAFGTREALQQNVPNPFNPRTAITFEMFEGGWAELGVYDVAGRWLRNLVHEHRSAGSHLVEWDGRDAGGHPVASGVYYYSLRTAQGHWMKRMTLLR
jgi:beta-glucanase (GH16 family)